MKKVISLIAIVSISFVFVFSTSIVADASIKQTESTRELSVGKTKSTLYAYAAFDRWGTNMSIAKEWDYTGRATIKDASKAGTLKLTIKGQASLKTSGSLTIGVGVDSVSAGSSGAWCTVHDSYSQTKAISKKSGKQSISDTSNLTVAPKKHYQNGTACITATALVKWKSSSKWNKISAVA